MTEIALVVTREGLSRFSAAQLGEDIDLTIATVGLTDQAFVAAPTLTVLPGEFRRLNTLSGQPVGDDVVHMVIRDEADIAYAVRGFGLFLADGTLFASHGQADRIVQKAGVAVLHLALDIAFPTGTTASLSFGDANFLNPPATTATKGVVELATENEADAGTPGALAITAALLRRAFGRRKVVGAGLVTGGGALDADRTLTVTQATLDDIEVGARQDRVVTPAFLEQSKYRRGLSKLGEMLTYTFTGEGLVKGGGSLGASRTFTVHAAEADDVDAGIQDDAAITPAALAGSGYKRVEAASLGPAGHRRTADGFTLCWGVVSVPGASTVTVDLPVPHESWVVPTGSYITDREDTVGVSGILGTPPTGFTVRNNTGAAVNFYWHTFGV